MFLTVTDSDKAAVVGIAAQLHDLGFQIVATRGTAAAISRMGIPVERLSKLGEGSPNVVDLIERGDVDLVINTPTGTEARTDGWEIRRSRDRARSTLHHDGLGRDGRGESDRCQPGKRTACRLAAGTASKRHRDARLTSARPEIPQRAAVIRTIGEVLTASCFQKPCKPGLYRQVA